MYPASSQSNAWINYSRIRWSCTNLSTHLLTRIMLQLLISWHFLSAGVHHLYLLAYIIPQVKAMQLCNHLKDTMPWVEWTVKSFEMVNFHKHFVFPFHIPVKGTITFVHGCPIGHFTWFCAKYNMVHEWIMISSSKSYQWSVSVSISLPTYVFLWYFAAELNEDRTRVVFHSFITTYNNLTSCIFIQNRKLYCDFVM